MQLSTHGAVRATSPRAYLTVAANEGDSTEAKQTQTDIELDTTTLVTPRPVLRDEQVASSPFAHAFNELQRRLRSSAWRPSLLIVLGHDPEQRHDEVEQRIREDEAAEVVDKELVDFFDRVLAPVMQQRETALVNTMQECIQHELQARQLTIQRQEKRIAVLTEQTKDWEKQVAHLKAKVDRRVNENNALRKEQYRQLLMLRDLVSKHSSEPGALSVLNEAIATVLSGKSQVESRDSDHSSIDRQNKSPGRKWEALNATTQALHREKEKWEQRAREATLECQELRDKVDQLTQESKESSSVPWFLDPENAVAERQRIAEAVCRSQGNWEDVGDSLVELLNNDLLWAAVEQSARRGGKRRVARGLEAVLTQLGNQSPAIEDNVVSDNNNAAVVASPPARRRSTFAELNRLIPCRACNGAGYVQTDSSESNSNDSDPYLRRTLEQVLELKKQLEKANNKSLTLEGELQLAHMNSTELQEKLDQLELIKSTAMDIGLQADLDEEEGVDMDEVMRSAYGQDHHSTSLRRNRKNAQYDHLIVELKNSLADKDAGLAESRKALEVAQTRAVKLQRALQKEKDTHAEELAALKTSLAFSLKTRNTKIEERQAAVKSLLKKFVMKTQQLALLKRSGDLGPMDEQDGDAGSDITDENEATGTDSGNALLQATSMDEHNEVKRMESLTQRYADDISRVRKEHEVQQELLKKAEAEMEEADDKRRRTNSISHGDLVINLASHPRDLFKALTTTQSDLLKLRRASQRSSALQTDRLLTLTTHLSHMSEELCTLRKRNLAETEFWKLECEKLQNTNKALEAERQICQRELQEAREQHADFAGNAARGLCSMCEKHKARLMIISNQFLKEAQSPRADPEVEVPATLTESERNTISSVLLDLESTYTGMNAAKQELARELIAAHIGSNLKPRVIRSANPSPARSSSHVVGKGEFFSLPRKTSSNPSRKSVSGPSSANTKRELRKTSEFSTVQQPTMSPTPTSLVTPPQEIPNEANSSMDAENASASEAANVKEDAFQSRRRKTLVEEILDEGVFKLSRHGLVVDAQRVDVLVSMKPSETPSDDNGELSELNSSSSNPDKHDEPQDYQDDSGEDDFYPHEEETPVLDDPNNDERDPEVINQLRYLISQSKAAKERLALTGWRVLVCRILLLRNQHRLQHLKSTSDQCVKVHPGGTYRPESRKYAVLRVAMEKHVQLYDSRVEGATSARGMLRRECKKAQTHLISAVSMLLTNLSGSGKPTTGVNDVSYLMQLGSPRRSPTSNRLLYPAAKIHLNRIPPTQQIPTSTFPALVTTNSSLESPPLDQKARPSSPRSGERAPEGFLNDEGYHLPLRLVKSAGARIAGSFIPVHSSVAALQGSLPFPDPVRIQDIYASSSHIAELGGRYTPQRPVRPHSSPAGPRLMSPRTVGMLSSASSQMSLSND